MGWHPVLVTHWYYPRTTPALPSSCVGAEGRWQLVLLSCRTCSAPVLQRYKAGTVLALQRCTTGAIVVLHYYCIGPMLVLQREGGWASGTLTLCL